MRFGILCALVMMAGVSLAEVQVIGGQKYECRDGLCYLVEDDTSLASGEGAASTLDGPARIAQGYMRAEEFIAFLEGEEVGSLAGHGLWVMLLLVLLGGLAMNLTPCVLPMVPINLMIIGRSAGRGAAYGLGIALAYGALGVGAAVGGLAFGDIQGSPWFNAAVSVLFVGLALALLDVWFIDFAKFRSGAARRGTGSAGFAFAFGMGAMSAVLAGACVAPVLISVLLLTTDLVAKGNRFAILLPFVMGVGMALPWPFAGAGMKVLPKPGAWMKWVNRVFGVVVLGFAAWYGMLAWRGFAGSVESLGAIGAIGSIGSIESLEAVGERIAGAKRPVLVDCWATWCKNCSAMDAVMADEKVKRALEPFEVLRVQAEDISELRKVRGFESVKGLPAFVIFE